MEILSILALFVLAFVPFAIRMKADHSPVRIKVDTKNRTKK